MAGYIGTQAVSVNTTSATISDDLTVGDDLTVTDDAAIGGTLAVTGVLTTTAATVFNGGFASNDGSTITTADNSTQLTLISTDADASVGPVLDLFRNTTGASADEIGRIQFTGKNDAGTNHTFAQMYVKISDATSSGNTEDAQWSFDTIVAGTVRERMGIYQSGIIINQESLDSDFRVESNGNAHMLFVDGGDDQVRIGRSGDVDGFNLVVGTTTAAGAIAVIGRADDISQVIFYEADASTTIGKIDARNSLFNFGSVANVPVGIVVNNSQMATFGANHLTIGDGNLIIGTAGHGIDFSNQASPAGGMTSELLDRYEEGTFTGTIFGGSTAGTYEVAAAGCHYTRIGNVVTCMFNIVLASSITAGGSGNMHFAGFPFPYDASLNTGDTNMCNVQGVDFNTNAIQLSLVRQSGSDTNVFVIAETLHNATQGVVQAGEFAANDTIRSTLTYFTLT